MKTTIENVLKRATGFIPTNTKSTLLLRAFGLVRIPLLFMASPKVTEISDTTAAVKIPLRKVVKNHWGTMYFGALAIGADAVVAVLATDKIYRTKKNVNLIFKSFNAQFLKRPDGDTIFVCRDGHKIDDMISRALDTGERVNEPIKAEAFVGDEKVADFILELSLKAT